MTDPEVITEPLQNPDPAYNNIFVPNNPRIVPTSDYLKLPRSSETWLIDTLLPSNGSLLLYGDAKLGKSFLALQMAAALAEGKEFLGFGVSSAVKVCYIQLDTPRSIWAERFEDLLHAQLTKSSSSGGISDGLLSLHLADQETLGFYPLDVLDSTHETVLCQALKPLSPDVVFLDTLRECHSGDENDSTAMQQVIARLSRIVKPAALVLISHSRKSNPETGYDLINDNRGSNYIVGRMDSICRLTKTSIRVSGRAIDEESIPVVREDDGLWSLKEDHMKDEALLILQTGKPIRELARELHEKYNRSEVAMRAYLRRLSHKVGLPK